MNTSQHRFAAEQYGARAQDYVASAVHSSGADLDQIEAALRGQSEARVLDLGCGGGHVSYRAAPHVAQVVACDVTPDMLEAVAATAAGRGLANIVTRQAPAERLPFPDAAFDAVLCRFTTHHWQNMEAGLREARRVLRAGRPALFIDTVAPANPVLDSHLQAVELLRDASHVRNYSVAEWVVSLSRAGFALEGIVSRRLRMEFASWTARTRTPPAHAEAIRSLLAAAPACVQEHFGLGADGSFDIEAVTFTLRAA
ncbi:class I SAM-dependent methyltransferase [Roseomonas sp. M0104]|uniref:Class I SAM-dependent methyltransferase n=1 Tax=Teichococcus coralli TaxID=2545983 RepID=A0A845BB33_9PROT|nr:class I SAM-dependent methyltransferase [Pseudoroseomonas coralli]MXP64005.1 class I SAM-dependent methyltransferase [Pseudoroseomonas coralli]